MTNKTEDQRINNRTYCEVRAEKIWASTALQGWDLVTKSIHPVRKSKDNTDYYLLAYDVPVGVGPGEDFKRNMPSAIKAIDAIVQNEKLFSPDVIEVRFYRVVDKESGKLLRDYKEKDNQNP